MEIVDKRQAILQAAAKRFSTDGYHETKVEQIAEDAGVAKGTVYLYFKDKNTLLFEVARYNMLRFVENLREAIKPYDTAQDKLRAYARYQITHFPEMAKFHKLNIEHFFKLGKNESMMQTMRKDQGVIRDLIVGIIEYGIERQEFRQIDVGQAAIIVVGAMQTYIHAVMFGMVEDKPEDPTDSLVDLLIGGFGRRD